MLKSMTAYSRVAFHSEVGDFVVEIQSVNRKFLEINASLPKELAYFEIELKKWMLPFVSRGQVMIKVSVSYENSLPILVHPNFPLAKELKKACDELAQGLHFEGASFLSLILAQTEGVLLFEDNLQEEDRYRSTLKQALEQAVEKFVTMKLQEGAILQADILERVQKIRHIMTLIEQKVPNATKKYREKLIARLEEVLPGRMENDDRILREVAVYAEKIDIAEEVIRFFYHLTHFEDLIKSETHSIGKTLEFVLQELNRESNTVGSKSADLEISRYVIDIKSELERIREQIQNVE